MLLFIDRFPTYDDTEELRLYLSTFTDGFGEVERPDGSTCPGGKNFEKTVAHAFGGKRYIAKYVFDVTLHGTVALSCKVKEALDRFRKHGEVYIEVANSPAKTMKLLELHKKKIDTDPNDCGKLLLQLESDRFQKDAIIVNEPLELTKSYFLNLLYDEKQNYQLVAVPLVLPNVDIWQLEGKKLAGYRGDKRLYEWYYASGGQLKHYTKDVAWKSDVFRLEQCRTKSLFDKVIESFG